MKKELSFGLALAWILTVPSYLFGSEPASVAHTESSEIDQELPPLTLRRLRPAPKARRRYLHPNIPLLSDRGQSVLKGDQPLSLMNSCGACHDTAYIADHNYHAKAGLDQQHPVGTGPSGRAWDSSPGLFGRWDPLTYRRLSWDSDGKLDLGTAEWIKIMGARHVGGGPAVVSRKDGRSLLEVVSSGSADPETHLLDAETVEPRSWDWKQSGTVELNCLLCHMHNPDNQERVLSLQRGDFKWASTATLLDSGLVGKNQGKYRWNQDAFDSQGAVPAHSLGISSPRSANCRLCHGKACRCTDPVVFENSLHNWSAETVGSVFSAGHMRDSGMNLSGKTDLATPWDVHAERLLDCTDCHHSPNNPAYNRKKPPGTSPDHLAFDARKLGESEYLQRPDHNLVKGHTAQGTLARRFDGSMRDCRDCHRAEAVHDFLPFKKTHFDRVSCQTCHVPRVFAPARKANNWTLLTSDGAPLVSHRGVQGSINDPLSLITGYQPALLLHRDANGVHRLGPHNMISSWFWVEGEPERPVRYLDLVQALFEKPGKYHPQVLRALDENSDGKLELGELRLDSEEKRSVIALRLESVSIARPRIKAEIQPYTISHGVLSVDFATKCCQCCHSSHSRITEPFVLADSVPGGVLPELIGDSTTSLVGTIEAGDTGRLLLKPSIDPDRMYIHGIHRTGWMDMFGMFTVVSTLLGIGLHGGLRLLAAKKLKQRGKTQ